jgi:hypothetical protein
MEKDYLKFYKTLWFDLQTRQRVERAGKSRS